MRLAACASVVAGLVPLASAIIPKVFEASRPLPHKLQLDSSESGFGPLLTSYTFDQPVDHNNASLGTFKQRYWVNQEFYEKGGPVVVFTPGESNAVYYTGYLTNRTLTGYIAQNFTGAVVLLEHRYWGESRPRPNLSVPNIQYLTIENSVRDLTYFASNVEFPFKKLKDTKPNQVPWVFVGGSYSGVLAAYVNVHPSNYDKGHAIYQASWATSAPVQPVWDYWSYFYPIMEHMTSNCSADVQRVIGYVDDVLEHGTHEEIHKLKANFGLQAVTHKKDFASALPIAIWQWQDQEAYTGYSEFWAFCDALEVQNGTVAGPHGFGLEAAFAAYGKFMKSYAPEYCGTDDMEACFGSYNKSLSFYTDISYDNDYRQWYWLICTVFGYWQNGAPAGKPTIVSRFVDDKYNVHYCRDMFPGKEGPHYHHHPDVPPPANFEVTKEFGGWNIKGDRLFIVNAGGDPWRDASTASDIGPYGEHPPSTPQQPEAFIKDGIHCWDLIVANWIDPYIPPVIEEGMAYLTKWLDEYKPY